ncbi:MAG: TIGR00282 family metallophosphoesterase [Candidatus Omnitrophica bacterium]|nr:TIGR00282 family metallophosphoesterase [Candidatus Omnitrophota bacterium]
MRVLFIGDIVGKPGREAVRVLVAKLRKESSLDFVIANAENAAAGSGITRGVAKELFDAGVDVITSGDHIWKKREIFELLSDERRILRPANYPPDAPGEGFGVFETPKHSAVGVLNVNGRVFMQPLDCPFRAAGAAVEELRRQTPVIIVDIHAEATSEKVAMGWFLDGKVSAVCGTHTHIQTADAHILPKRTAYITDVGMTGPYASVIGRKVEDVLEKFITAVPARFNVAEEDVQLHGAVIEIDERTGEALSIERIQRKTAHA